MLDDCIAVVIEAVILEMSCMIWNGADLMMIDVESVP